MKVGVDVLLKTSMAHQLVRTVDRLLKEGHVIEGWPGTAEQLREEIDSGSLQERFLHELIGEDTLAEIRRQGK